MKSLSVSCLTVVLFVATFLATFPSVFGQQTASPPKVLRLLYSAYDGDPRKDPYEKITFQINTADLRQPSEFLKLGQWIPNTRLKLSKFEYKVQRGTNGQQEDVSEL